MNNLINYKIFKGIPFKPVHEDSREHIYKFSFKDIVPAFISKYNKENM